jgi:hypothetical protein
VLEQSEGRLHVHLSPFLTALLMAEQVLVELGLQQPCICIIRNGQRHAGGVTQS